MLRENGDWNFGEKLADRWCSCLFFRASVRIKTRQFCLPEWYLVAHLSSLSLSLPLDPFLSLSLTLSPFLPLLSLSLSLSAPLPTSHSLSLSYLQVPRPRVNAHSDINHEYAVAYVCMFKMAQLYIYTIIIQS